MLELIGRLHILILHLPIGILLLGVLLEWLHYFKLSTIPISVRSLIFGIGSLATLGASLTGYLLSTSGDYHPTHIQYHQWAAYITIVLSIAVCLSLQYYQGRMSLLLTMLIAVSITITGHLGGSITHGQDFLTMSQDKSTETSAPIFAFADPKTAELYTDIVYPILQARCISCHQASKTKGKLRLDTYELMLKGGKSGKSLLGSVKDAELMRRIELPVSHEEHMPPQDKPQLTEDEKSIIALWLQQGADPSLTISDITAQRDIVPMLLRMQALSLSSAPHPDGHAIVDQPRIEAPKLDMQHLALMQSMNIIALPESEQSALLNVNLVNVDHMTPQHWDAISKVSENIARLRISDHPLQPQDIIRISTMTHLSKLYMDNTQLTDEGLMELSRLKNLTYLNISNNPVTDTGIHKIDALQQKLNIIYAYQTAISIDSLPSGMKIVRGGFSLKTYPEDTIRIPQN